MNLINTAVLLCLIHILSADAARILAVFSVAGRGQYAFVEPLLLQLANRGHNITAISNYPQNEKRDNFRDIVIEENKHLFDDFKNYTTDHIDSNYYDVVHGIYKRTYEMCINVLSHPTVREMMRSDSFDLIITDALLSESLYGFAQHFRAPIIGVSSYPTLPALDSLVGNTTPLSYIPDFVMLRPYSLNMNLWQRCLNVAIFVVEWIHYIYKYMPVQEKIYEHYFPNASLTFEETQKNFSLVLVNDHFTLSTSRPYVPNMIDVAGMHIPTKTDTLPRHINELLSESKYGVVYVQTEIFPEYIMDILLQEFQKLPQTILWNLNTTLSKDVKIPNNVHIHCNLEHHGIISHPNIRLIVSYCTYLDVIESIHWGVPMLKIPNINGELDNYVDYIKKNGNGISIKLQQFNTKSLAWALHELLDTDRYQRNAKTLSQRFRDQQNTPLERALYWVEYVIRHKGAAHMRNLGQNLNTWQFYNLDVLICFICVILCVVCMAYVIVKIFIYILRESRIKRNVKSD